jgi:hypothetical protein
MIRILAVSLAAIVLCAGITLTAFSAEDVKSNEKAVYGTVIAIDPEAKTLKLIGTDGVMLDVAAEDKAAKYLDKIPLNSLIDLIVEMRDGAPPVVKSWKMAQAKSPCRVFDGKMCNP